jgi:hypothetical protein
MRWHRQFASQDMLQVAVAAAMPRDSALSHRFWPRKNKLRQGFVCKERIREDVLRNQH